MADRYESDGADGGQWPQLSAIRGPAVGHDEPHDRVGQEEDEQGLDEEPTLHGSDSQAKVSLSPSRLKGSVGSAFRQACASAWVPKSEQLQSVAAHGPQAASSDVGVGVVGLGTGVTVGVTAGPLVVME